MEIRISQLSNMKIILLVFIVITITIERNEAVESISGINGRRQSCSNEGEEVKLEILNKEFRCFKCICRNGFVQCEKKNCPSVDDCYVLEKQPEGACCEKCKECIYKGMTYASGIEWSDPEDSCITFKCVAGVITETTVQCYTPCSKPIPPRPGQCCPTCFGCYLNGQTVDNGREVTLTEDPCLKCQCSNKRLTCMKKACPVLQCPISKQIKAPGECCPRCSERREIMQIPGKCILGKGFHSDGKHFSPDHCSMCTCINGTSVCHRNTCPVLECSPEYQKTNPGECCPHCPPNAEARSTCTVDDKTYQNNETWNLNSCRSCKCHNGEIRCAQMNCPKIKCRPDETPVTLPGQCCSQCVESAGVCTVFGDPHYRTFDGKFFSFQGSCKYQLSSDCRNNTFLIRVTNDGRKTKSSSWVKGVTIKLKEVRVNLGQKLRVKVNGTKVSMPYTYGEILQINRTSEGLLLTTQLGIQVEWDGNNFIQLQVPTTYKNRLCGLCGNYNSMARDDLTSKDGYFHSDAEVWRFANSWKVGGTKACSRKRENLAKRPNCKYRKNISLCNPLRETDVSQVFGDCDGRLNSVNYFEACKIDMCECSSRMCYCDSFAAYAHECKRLGVKLPNWRDITGCPIGGITSQNQVQNPPPFLINYNNDDNQNNKDQDDIDIPDQDIQRLYQQHHLNQKSRKKTRRPPEYLPRHIPETFLVPKPSGRTPPPLH